MNTLTNIDSQLLKLFQKFSDFTQSTFGPSCFTLARGCLGIFSICSFFSLFFMMQLMFAGGGGLFLAFGFGLTVRLYILLDTSIILYEMKNTGDMLRKNNGEIELKIARIGLVLITSLLLFF